MSFTDVQMTNISPAGTTSRTEACPSLEPVVCTTSGRAATVGRAPQLRGSRGLRQTHNLDAACATHAPATNLPNIPMVCGVAGTTAGSPLTKGCFPNFQSRFTLPHSPTPGSRGFARVGRRLCSLFSPAQPSVARGKAAPCNGTLPAGENPFPYPQSTLGATTILQ